jgi:hypothetical protein
VNLAPETNLPDLPPYTLDVQAMDLGPDTKAVGLELIETESREPLRGEVAAGIWAAVLPALANQEAWVLDFFSHIDRVREYCQQHEIEIREAANRCLVVQAGAGKLRELVVRFAGETFGVRCGEATKSVDTALEGQLSQRGLDAYQDAYKRYSYCGICEPDDGWLTLLSETIWASEIIRRARPALKEFDVYIVRPQ